MSYTIIGKRITMTRGDSVDAAVTPYNPDGTEYELQPGDTMRFKMRAEEGGTPILVKDVTDGSLTIEHSDTANLDYGRYFYDVQMTFANGKVDTFIPDGRLTLTAEADEREV